MSDASRAEQISARLTAATPGPWSEIPGRETWRTVVTFDDGKERDLAIAIDVEDPADADLIANAPTDLAWLLAERAALLRLLDAERARADAAEAKVASAFKRGYDAGTETANSDWP